ncbi:MAG: tRNA uridine-5-carboxymethylaminomethyl(34) synthesis GTPase MnmE, partial [Barnesiella sp.]|nr:tRNA uridine-5-carboxymethylaminomethyl(34) synthesis GTPase MnmE [Barnesiella sp.]
MELKLNKPIPEDTICAISTAPGMGGIAVIRISGTNAIIITDRIFYTAN